MTKHAQNRKRFGRRNFKQRYFRLTTHSLSYSKAKGKRPLCDIPLTELVAVERLENRSFKMQNIFRVSNVSLWRVRMWEVETPTASSSLLREYSRTWIISNATYLPCCLLTSLESRWIARSPLSYCDSIANEKLDRCSRSSSRLNDGTVMIMQIPSWEPVVPIVDASFFLRNLWKKLFNKLWEKKLFWWFA